jgi:putative transcriptional regulator
VKTKATHALRIGVLILPMWSELLPIQTGFSIGIADGIMARSDIGFWARLTVGFSFWFTRPAMMSFGSYRPAKLTVERFRNMKKRQVTVDLEDIGSFPKGRVNNRRLDETSEEDLTFQQASDEAEAMDDAARFARRVRRRLGLTQLEFSVRINVSQETIRNWEQGKRCPTGAAKALLKVLDKAPEAALHALS